MAFSGSSDQTLLPPYIKRSGGDFRADRERYQTVYSKHLGAIAAPTAGLHFTDDILARFVPALRSPK